MLIGTFVAELGRVLAELNKALSSPPAPVKFDSERFAADLKRQNFDLTAAQAATSGQTVKVGRNSERRSELEHQAATLLRLLDGARWVQQIEPCAEVILVNATTSRAKTPGAPVPATGLKTCSHDLVVTTPAGGQWAFEAADIIGGAADPKWKSSVEVLGGCVNAAGHKGFVVMSADMADVVKKRPNVQVNWHTSGTSEIAAL